MSGNSGDTQGGRRLAMPTEGALYLWLRISRNRAATPRTHEVHDTARSPQGRERGA